VVPAAGAVFAPLAPTTEPSPSPPKNKTAINRPQFWYSEVPARFSYWRQHGIHGSVRPLAQLPSGFLIAYNDYFAESGWEDAPKTRKVALAGAKERAFVSARARRQEEVAAAAAAAAAAGPLAEVGGAIAAAAEAAAGVAEGVLQQVPHWYSVRPPLAALPGRR
jgi:hypothetical protein